MGRGGQEGEEGNGRSSGRGRRGKVVFGNLMPIITCKTLLKVVKRIENSFLNVHPEVMKSPNLFEITCLAWRILGILLADSSNQKRVILKSINNHKTFRGKIIY